jgi:solute carrier family 25 carnitine/acylcarnitine transporter 20/29
MPSQSLQTLNELVAGSVAGATQVLVGQPLDTIKTRAQIAPSFVPPYDCLCIEIDQRWKPSQRECLCVSSSFLFKCARIVFRSLSRVKKGPMDILFKTVKNEGFFALYKGNSFILLL